MLSPRISEKRLVTVCRSLGTSLRAGLSVVKAFELAARKSAGGRQQRVFQSVVKQIRAGEQVSDAIASHGRYFPRLMVDMVHVAEQAGALPEVLLALSEHYENNVRLRKDFLGLIALPAIQFVAAVFVIAGLIWILGIIGGSGGEALDVLGFGLTGGAGAMQWLAGWAMAIAGLFVAYKVIAANASGRAFVHRLLLLIPVVGGCLRSFAVARFSWAFHLTQEAGMPIDDSLVASLKATANGAFAAAAPQIVGDVMEGDDLYEALANSGMFPEQFLEIVHTAEVSGTVPEELHRLSGQLEEDARRSMRMLAMAAGWMIWAMVAAFIIFLILRIMMWYTGLINAAANDALGI